MRYAGWREHEDAVDFRDDVAVDRDVFYSRETTTSYALYRNHMAEQHAPKTEPVVPHDTRLQDETDEQNKSQEEPADQRSAGQKSRIAVQDKKNIQSAASKPGRPAKQTAEYSVVKPIRKDPLTGCLTVFSNRSANPSTGFHPPVQKIVLLAITAGALALGIWVLSQT